MMPFGNRTLYLLHPATPNRSLYLPQPATPMKFSVEVLFVPHPRADFWFFRGFHSRWIKAPDFLSPVRMKSFWFFSGLTGIRDWFSTAEPC